MTLSNRDKKVLEKNDLVCFTDVVMISHVTKKVKLETYKIDETFYENWSETSAASPITLICMFQ